MHLPEREKQGEGEKRMGCHLYINNVCLRWVDLRVKCPCGGWWIITSTLSWTVIQLAASFWRISVTPLESLSYFSLGSSSLSSSWWRKQTCKMGSRYNVFLKVFITTAQCPLRFTMFFESHRQNPSTQQTEIYTMSTSSHLNAVLSILKQVRRREQDFISFQLSLKVPCRVFDH